MHVCVLFHFRTGNRCIGDIHDGLIVFCTCNGCVRVDTMIIHASSSDDHSTALATVATAHQVHCMLAFRAHNGGIRVYTNMIIHTSSSYDTFRARNHGNCTPSGSLACFIYIYSDICPAKWMVVTLSWYIRGRNCCDGGHFWDFS
jgi:hypothetical protein